MYHLILWIVVSAATTACAGAAPETKTVTETALVESPLPASDEGANTPSSSPETEAAVPGQIRRADLNRVLDLGPGGLLALVETEPFREAGRFVGFRIVRFSNGDPSAVDLRAGDVLCAVNGLPIASPDDFFRAFQELKVASELRFDLFRDGASLTFQYPVVE